MEPDRLAHMLIFMWKNTGKMELSSLRRSLALLQTVYSSQTVSSVDAAFAPDFSSQACTVTSSVNVTCEDRMKGMMVVLSKLRVKKVVVSQLCPLYVLVQASGCEIQSRLDCQALPV